MCLYPNLYPKSLCWIAVQLLLGMRDEARSESRAAETLENALRYVGATDDQIALHRKTMQQTGQETSDIRLLPKRKTCSGSTFAIVRGSPMCAS
jgi:hypothetical protein